MSGLIASNFGIGAAILFVLLGLLIWWLFWTASGNGALNFIKDSFEEMTTNVTWSKYSELQSSTILVIVASLVFAVLIGLIDFMFKTGMSLIYG